MFLSLYQAIGNANTLASERVGAVVALLDPPKTKNIFAHDLLTALSAGLALLPGANTIAGTIVKTASQIPSIVGLLFPVGTTDSRIAQWANIDNELATVVQYYQGNISEIIPAVNNNLENFIAYAGTGQFSVNPLPDLSDESDALLQGLLVLSSFATSTFTDDTKGLTTFVIGKALDVSNIHLSRATNLDVHELQTTSGDYISFDTGCGDGYDEKGICGSCWFDAKNKVTYTLNKYKSMADSYHDQMETMFGNWTTGDLIFGGAARCAAAGGLKDGSLATTVINPNAGNAVSFDCLSSA